MLHRVLAVWLVPAIAIAALPFSAAATGQALDRIVHSGVVRVAVPDNFPPFGDLGTDGKLHGYDIDTAALVADALGVKLEPVPVPSPDRIATLLAGKVDLIISSLGKNAEREKEIAFSIAYAPFFTGVFGPKQIVVSGPSDLAGKTVAVTRDTIEDAVLTKLAPQTATLKRYNDNARTELAYLSGEAELITTGNVFAADVAKSPMKKTTLKFLLRNSPCYIGISKGESELIARIDSILIAARKDGSLNRIAERWLKRRLGDPENPDWMNVTEGSGAPASR